jgi:hypothetical protein
MVLEKNKFCRDNNKYLCDMCHKKMNSNSRVVISKAEQFENNKKKWDLCKNCYNKVVKSVESYYEKHM